MNLAPIIHNQQRVLTTQQLAESYGTDVKTISNNFTRNKERYLEGKHFHRLEGEELQAFKGIHQNDESLKFVSVLYLWTEKGAWHHAKSLNTEEAWNAYEMLVDDYYEIKDQSQLPLTVEDMIIMQANSVKELKAKMDHMEITTEFAKEQAITAHQRIDAMDNTDLIGDLQQRLVRKVNKYSERNGFTYSAGWKDFRQCFNTAFRTNLGLKKTHYMRDKGIKRMTFPEYLAATEQLPDALRVAEKMLQPGNLLG